MLRKIEKTNSKDIKTQRTQRKPQRAAEVMLSNINLCGSLRYNSAILCG